MNQQQISTPTNTFLARLGKKSVDLSVSLVQGTIRPKLGVFWGHARKELLPPPVPQNWAWPWEKLESFWQLYIPQIPEPDDERWR